MSDNRFDETLRAIREETPDAKAEAAAAARVWNKLSEHEPIRGCAGFQSLIPAHVAGELTPARALLMKDHLHECVACRKIYDAARGASPRVAAMPGRRAPMPAVWKWAIAAAATVAVGLGSWEAFNRMPAPERARATVESVEGGLLLVSADGIRPLAAGTAIEAGTTVRTPKDARAMLRLADGSLVETRERSEFFVSATRRDTTVHLARGSVIVEAAQQRTGHLYVTPRDCRVAVTGTVFSVSSGVKGSRVSVVEGQVRVEHGSGGQVLKPGQQYTTSEAVERVPVQDDIAWSRRFTEHVALMRELAGLGKEIERMPLPAERYSSKLIDLLPRETVFFASVPNLGPTLAEAHNIFRQRMQDSPVLREWYQKEFERGGGGKLEEVVHQIRAVSDYLGDEVVMAVVREGGGRLSEPILFAEVRKPGLVEHVRSEVEKQGVKIGGEFPLAVRGNIAMFSPRRRSLPAAATGGFAGTPFHAALSKAYSGGAGMLFAGDFASLCAGDTQKNCAPLRMLGEVRHLLVEQGTSAGHQELRATVTMDSARGGLMSWIAEPGPMGALDFFSPEATVLVALALENPASVLEQFLAGNAEAQRHLEQVQQQLGIDVRRDIAGALGGEVAGGIDGPMLPAPAWKFVVEVYDSGRLQQSVERMLEAANRMAAMAGHAGATLTPATANGRTYYTLTPPQTGGPVTEIHYTYADGYLIAAGSRALVDAALQNRASRNTIARSTEFTAMIPRGSSPHFSGLVYQNAGKALGPVADLIQGTLNLDENQRKTVQSAASELKPTLLAFYRESDRLSVATKSGLLGLNNLFGLGSTVGMLEQLGRAQQMKSRGAVKQ
jgi:ferric-dicitrate binding protein FerR (iron transport regulator)